MLFQNYLTILITPSKCLKNVHLLCKCNVMSSSNIKVRFDSSKFRLVISKRTKDKNEKDILTKFTTMTPVHSRVSRGKKITLSLTDKVKLLDLHKQKPELRCCPLVELFKETCNIKVGKSQIAKVIKNESNIRREYENFESNMNRKKIAKYGIINDVLYEWYIICCQARIYPDGAMLQKEVLKIKTKLNDSTLGDFKASNGWLEHFKKRFVLRQTRIVGEAGDVRITTIKAWMERLPEIIQDCSADVGIIRNFKVKYRKQLLKHVISRIDDRKKASEIIQGVDLLQ